MMRWLVLLLAVGCGDAQGLEGELVPLCGDELICSGWCLRGGEGVTDHTLCIESECHEMSACCVESEVDGLWLDVPAEYCKECDRCR